MMYCDFLLKDIYLKVGIKGQESETHELVLSDNVEYLKKLLHHKKNYLKA